jgi:chaperonin GroES
MLRPLGHRLIVRPEPAAAVSAGGILIPQTADKKPAMAGTVISIGRGPATAHRVRQYTLAQVVDKLQEVAERVPTAALKSELEDEIARMAVEDVTFSEVKEGDYVCFPFTAGQNMHVDGEDYIVIQEDDLEAVWSPDEAQEVA